MNSPSLKSHPVQPVPKRTFANPLLQLLMGIGMISIGVLLFWWSSGNQEQAEPAGQVSLPHSLPTVALAQPLVQQAMAAESSTGGEPQVEVNSEQHTVQNSYCMWPGDTLSEIAYFANVDEALIYAINAEFTGGAGTNILLPEGSRAPADWPAPLTKVSAIHELPFGISGYYISYDNRRKRVSLSFDIGYVPRNHEIMATLAQRGIRATYFMLGEAVERHPEIIPHVLDNGHELANHSFTHDNMQGMSEDEIRAELGLTEQAVQAAVPGATTKPLFRAPFGAIDDRMVQVASQEGYHVIGWTVDSRDWTDGITADGIYERVTQHVCPGAIIAMHDVNPANYLALPRIIDYLEANGYEFATVSEMLFP